MLDIKFITQNPQLVSQALDKRQDSAPLAEILSLDERRRKLVSEIGALRAQHRKLSKGLAVGGRDPETLGKLRDLGQQIEVAERELKGVEGDLERLLLEIPNIPDPSVPVGQGEEGNVVVWSGGGLGNLIFHPSPIGR